MTWTDEPGGQPPGQYPPPPSDPSWPPPPPTYPSGGSEPPRPWSQPGGASGSLAGWWYRVGATVIDDLIVGIVGLILFGAIARLSALGEFFAQLLVSLAYAIFMIGSARAQTIGMMAVGNRAVDASTEGPPGGSKAALRALVRVALNITIIGGLLDVLWPLWDPQNQTLHDKAAGTVVVRVR